jgi:hypothetical protein
MPDQYSVLRHSIRGAIHALKLGVAVLEVEVPAEEAVEFLDGMIESAEKMSSLLDDYEALPWPPEAPTPAASPVN